MVEGKWGWSDELALGYAPMDDTHREFVERYVALSDASPDTCIEKLDALIAHTVAHFEQENQWMRAFDFPAADCHIAEHESVLEMMRDARQLACDGQTIHAIHVAELSEELPEWFKTHVATMDLMLANFMQRIGFDGGPPAEQTQPGGK